MTVTHENKELAGTEMVTGFIDDVEVRVPKGTLVIRAAEHMGTEIPRFCDHPLLKPVAACRMCLVEIEGLPKPQPSCAIELTEGMRVKTQNSSEVADQAQAGVMEFLLINHPLDCPVCDKGGECPLQNQAMSAGRPEARFDGTKRTFPKPINVSAQILLDRERCVSCARCTRFADDIAGDPLIELLERGSNQQVGTGEDAPFDSYFSGNVVQICPVGALTSASYRFRSRPFDLVSVPTTCEHCASGCKLRTDYRRGVITRRLAWEDASVNEDWSCDKGRFAFTYLPNGRVASPMIRRNGELEPASWPEALAYTAEKLALAKGRAGVLTGGRLTLEDAYAYARFARVALDTDNIDFRARVSSAEEASFLAAHVAGKRMTTTYADLETAPYVLLVSFEPEDESPIVFLRLRKGSNDHGVKVASVAPFTSRGLTKLNGSLIQAVPGDEGKVIASLDAAVIDALRQPGAVILVGERIAGVTGGPSAVAKLAEATGAKLAWIPRRAGDRGALEAGALAGLLPGGRPITNADARAQAATIWGVDAASLPHSAGQDTAGILQDASRGVLSALVIAGVELEDLDPSLNAASAVERAAFVVALATHHNSVTELADVVFPVAAASEKTGTYVDWEGRHRPFGQVFNEDLKMPDAQVLSYICGAMGIDAPADVRAELAEFGEWSGDRVAAPAVAAGSAPATQLGQAVLATWRQLLDSGALQADEPHLAATARPSVAVLSPSAAAAMGETVKVSTAQGSLTLPVVAGDIPDGVVWLPMRSPGCDIHRDLGVDAGAVVSIEAGGAS